jgi:hypothetical protein
LDFSIYINQWFISGYIYKGAEFPCIENRAINKP